VYRTTYSITLSLSARTDQPPDRPEHAATTSVATAITRPQATSLRAVITLRTTRTRGWHYCFARWAVGRRDTPVRNSSLTRHGVDRLSHHGPPMPHALPPRLLTERVRDRFGRAVILIESLPIAPGQAVEVEFVAVNSTWRQGLWPCNEGRSSNRRLQRRAVRHLVGRARRAVRVQR
jgi:hypothetical protein